MTSQLGALHANLRTGFRRNARRLAERGASSALRNPRFRRYAFNALHLLTDSASVVIDGVQYAFPTTDWIIGRSLYVDGRWDDEFMDATIKLLSEVPGSRSFQDGVFVDVGANIGTTTIQALQRYGAKRAIAVEPSPSCLPYLYANIAANRLSARCEIIEAAISDTIGEVAFRAGRDNSGAGEVLQQQVDGGQDHTVKTQRLDDLIAALDVSPADVSLVWADTEGHEYRVLSGARTLIDAGAPLLIEFWPHRLRENGDYERLVDMLAHSFKSIIDVRAYVQGTRESSVKTSVDAINAQANALGPWPTDLLLMP